MSTDTLEFPPIDEAAAQASTALTEHQPGAVDLTKIDLQAVALAGFNPARAALATAKATLKGVQHDLSTPTKLADAKSLRNRLIKVPLADARATSRALKSRLTAVSKAVGAELVAIEADFEAAEKLITPQIDAAQAKLDAEREAARLKEEARVQAHRDALAKLAAPADKAAGPDMTAERIALGITLVEAIVIDRAAWEEFADRAEEQKAVTLERMRALHTKAVVAEAEALRLAEERAEAARVAEAQRAEAERLAAIAADLARQQAELQAERDRIAAEAQARADEAARVEREQQESIARAAHAEREEHEAQARAAEQARQQQEADALAAQSTNTPEQGSQQVLKAEAPAPDATDRDAPASTSPSVGSMGAGQATDVAPSVAPTTTVHIAGNGVRFVNREPASAELSTMTLGQIGTRLGFNVTEGFLAGLGFEAHKEKASRLYRPSLFPAICEAISAHVLLLGSEAKKAA